MARRPGSNHEQPSSERLANYHLDAWHEFVRLTPEEHENWERRLQYIRQQKTLEQLSLSKKISSSKIIQCITTREYFKSVSEAAKHFNISRVSVYHALKEQRAVKGLWFKYIVEGD